LKTALKNLQFPDIPMPLFYDKYSVIDLAKNHQISELSKQNDIYHHRVQELVYDKTLPLMYIQTTDTLVDMCTSGLPKVQLSKLGAIALGFNEGGY
jgi:hypothetical protein